VILILTAGTGNGLWMETYLFYFSILVIVEHCLLINLFLANMMYKSTAGTGSGLWIEYLVILIHKSGYSCTLLVTNSSAALN
jgi:hypothetical protein